jgi:Spy/CpxP family protein refolding chaperone
MGRRPRRIVLLGLVIAAGLAAAPAFAEPPPAQGQRAQHQDPKKRAEVDARIKQLRADVLRKRVGLEPQKAEQVERILQRHAPQRRKLQEKLRAHRSGLDRLLDDNSNDQQAYARELKGLKETQGELQKLRQREAEELSRELTPKQQAKLVQAMRHLHKRLRRHLRDFDRSRAP